MSTVRTKIVCTLGPASHDAATIDRLIAAGMSVARLNMSHGSHEGHAETLERVRRAAADRNAAVAILQDLQGPKIRTGQLVGGEPVQLVAGEPVAVTPHDEAGTAERFTIRYDHLLQDVGPGDRILLVDGLIELHVEERATDALRCRVVTGGRLAERQGVALPGVELAAPSLTDQDRADIAWGVAQDVDYIALSFVRRPADVLAARSAIEVAGGDVPLIAKLEKASALDQLDAILDVADGVMVARGDMGVELPPEEVPGWQKRIIVAANARAKPVITATQMLESMVQNPRPTRAEATDVANAIWDGSDAVMLSAETAAGAYPVEAVMMMRRIALTAERDRRFLHIDAGPPRLADFPAAISSATAAIVRGSDGIRAIIAFTRDGASARLIARDRPEAPVLAITDDESVQRRLALIWGVTPMLGAPAGDLTVMLAEAKRVASGTGAAAPGDALLLIGHLPPDAPGSTNFALLHRL